VFPRRKKAKNVYVLGAGPAGLLAAHAAMSLGYNVRVLTRHSNGEPIKSELYGCQYLHARIPYLNMPQTGEPVRYQLDGPVEEYRQKVYGTNWTGDVSPDEYGPETEHPAWDIRVVYDYLWDLYEELIYPCNLNRSIMTPLFGDFRVVSSIPAESVCRRPEDHKFVSQKVWAMGSRDINEGQYRMPYVAPDMTVQCNGHNHTGWYRAATVFGYSTVEWPGARKPPIDGVAAVSKPLSTDCDCWLNEGMVRVGRYGQWKKGVLVHTAYYDTVKALS